jgi:hypothetical protein
MTIRPALALVAACAVLFGASYAGAQLTQEGDAREAQPATPAPAPSAPTGRELALSRSAGLPTLRKVPKREPRPAPAAPGAAPAPAPLRPSPAPRPVATGPETPEDGGTAPQPTQEGQTFDLKGQETAPSPPQPAPQQTSAPTDFYDEGG